MEPTTTEAAPSMERVKWLARRSTPRMTRRRAVARAMQVGAIVYWGRANPQPHQCHKNGENRRKFKRDRLAWKLKVRAQRRIAKREKAHAGSTNL